MANDGKGVITARIFRCNPSLSDETRYDKYEIECDHALTVLAILRHIFRTLDPTLAFRDYECYRGICLSCEILVGGKKAKTCSVMVEPGEEIVIDPLQNRALIKDLVVSFD